MIQLLSTIGRWLRGLIVILVFTVVAIMYAAKPELAGMKYVGSIRYPEFSEESSVDVFEQLEREWTQSAGKSSPEVYRFVYHRSFYDPICVSAWRDGERYWIRSSVALMAGHPLPTSHQWEKTHALSSKRWAQIRAIFSKPSVTDPLNGKEEGFGWDGSTWIIESVVDGRTTRTAIWSPILTETRETAQARPEFTDFVDAGCLMLKYGRVTVWNLF